MTDGKVKYHNQSSPEIQHSGGWDELACPICKNANLHQKKTEIFQREEDEEKGLHISVKDKKVSVDDNIADNPSFRRQGLVIYFTCEHCDGVPNEMKEVEYSSRLVIYQHKGSTILQMESV